MLAVLPDFLELELFVELEELEEDEEPPPPTDLRLLPFMYPFLPE